MTSETTAPTARRRSDGGSPGFYTFLIAFASLDGEDPLSSSLAESADEGAPGFDIASEVLSCSSLQFRMGLLGADVVQRGWGQASRQPLEEDFVDAFQRHD